MDNRADPLAGHLVDERYEILERVARGGMASVYRARDLRLERIVAVKIMHPHLAESTDFVRRFRREARAAARLSHPGVVAVHDQGASGDSSYLAMEFVDGPNLRAELRARGSLTLGQSLDVLEQVLDALAAAHRAGLVHRDIKPENILITADGRVKVADFGLARAISETTAATSGTVLGTVAYIAPETVLDGVADPPADVYGVGVVAYELITGAPPFTGATPAQVAFQHVNSTVPPPGETLDWVPREVDDLVAALTARDPAERPSDAGQALALVRRTRGALSPEVLDRRSDVTPQGPLEFDDPASRDTAETTAQSVQIPIGAIRTEPRPMPRRARAGSTVAAGAAPARPQAPRRPPAPPAPGPDPEPRSPLPPATAADTAPLARVAGGGRAVGDVRDTRPIASLRADARAAGDDAGPGRGARGRRRPAALLVPLLLLVLVLAGGAWWSLTSGPFAGTPVPDVTGRSSADAVAALEAEGFTADLQEAFSDDVAEGNVVRTEPFAGERSRAEQVVVVVSRGVEMLTVPDVLGMPRGEAVDSLTDARFTVGEITESYDDDVPAGEVLSTSPRPGQVVPHDRAVDVVVSQGREPAALPSVVGLTTAEAVAELEDVGLVPVLEEDHSDTVAEGRVIRQSPLEGEAYVGDEVTIVVSLGPELVEVPDLINSHVDDAVAELEELGLEPRREDYFGGFHGTVREQVPEAGTMVERGTVVTLRVV